MSFDRDFERGLPPRNACCYTGVFLLGLLISSLILADSAKRASGYPEQPAGDRPNIILIVADDLDLGSISHMPNLEQHLAREGVTFGNFFVTNALCCPSRATILRGQYTHNHQIQGNASPNGGFEKFRELGLERSTVASWLQSAGYETILIGRYLNEYNKDPDYVPPGWTKWIGLTGSYFNYKLNYDGQLVSYGSAPEDYSTDVLTEEATKFIEGGSRSRSANKPFFMYLAPYAPHAPAHAAERHKDLFADTELPESPSINEQDVTDKPAWIREKALLDPGQEDEINSLYRSRLRSLQAVDEMIANLISSLEANQLLNNTYIFFTSDNGFHMGHHRLLPGKWTPYEEDIRVPLIVRGPGLPKGTTREHLATNNDLAPTFADLASISPPAFVDGISLLPLLRADTTPVEWRKRILIESKRSPVSGRPAFKALRTSNSIYIEYANGETEAYDLKTDPYKLNNISKDIAQKRREHLQSMLVSLRNCAGVECKVAEGIQPPGTPANLRATAIPDEGVTLEWTPNKEKDLAGYAVYRSNSDTGPFIKLTESPLEAYKYLDSEVPVGQTSYYQVEAIDRSGHRSSPASVEVTVPDTIPPDTSITSGPEKFTNDPTPEFTIAAKDVGPNPDLVEFSHTLNDQEWSSYLSERKIVLGASERLSDGNYIFRVRSRDAAGNVDPTPAKRTFRIDTVPPDTYLGGISGRNLKKNAVKLYLASNEWNSTFECSLDNKPASDCTSPVYLTGLEEGWHSIKVWAAYRAGNKDPEPFRASWRVDTRSPAGSVKINGGAFSTKNREVILRIRAFEPEPGSGVVKMRIRNKGGSWTLWQRFTPEKRWRLRGKEAGKRTVFVQLKDRAGNTSGVFEDSIKLAVR